MRFDWPKERPHFAIVKKVIDGDTIVCDIDMDLRGWYHDYKVRLAGCNAAEVKTEAGKAARAHLKDVLPIGSVVVLTTIKDYKYGGEFVAKVWVDPQNELVKDLIQHQWAAAWDGRGEAPLPPWPRTTESQGEVRAMAKNKKSKVWGWGG